MLFYFIKFICFSVLYFYFYYLFLLFICIFICLLVFPVSVPPYVNLKYLSSCTLIFKLYSFINPDHLIKKKKNSQLVITQKYPTGQNVHPARSCTPLETLGFREPAQGQGGFRVRVFFETLRGARPCRVTNRTGSVKDPPPIYVVILTYSSI